MGVKYLTAYAQSLGAPIVADTTVPSFRDVDDGTTTNLIVLDGCGGMARYLKPDESERSLYDFQELFERVAVDMAALRALGYAPVVFLDAAIPSAKVATWVREKQAAHGLAPSPNTLRSLTKQTTKKNPTTAEAKAPRRA
jgi:hypothetical protein